MSPLDLKTKEKLIDFLLQGEFLTKDLVEDVQKEAQASGESFEAVLFRKEFLKDSDLGKIIADFYGWNFVNLKNENIPQETLGLIPEALARERHVLAFAKTNDGVKVALKDPGDTALSQTLQAELRFPIIPYFATPKDLEANLNRYQVKIEKEFKKLIEAYSQEATFGSTQEGAVVQLVDLMIRDAYQKRASDIHLDPQGDGTIVRFRIDGVLHDIGHIPSAIHLPMISRIKVMSKLHTDEHQIPQDGKITFQFDAETSDIRVSIMPTTKGENAVLRLLSEKSRSLSLEDLGLRGSDFKKLRHAITQPWGMIMVTGPTGSGKTTTLYAILKILNTKEVNIATIEDPVEYNISGITQIQANPKAHLTFASGLRSILRQDPNIIMVGEIRDVETADIAINSALTGHLVLSTLHTNDAATALPRLIEMEIERYLVASTVNLIVAQRLVRKICERCRRSEDVTLDHLKTILPKEMLEKLQKGKSQFTLYKGAGCAFCDGTGYWGRMGIFEIIEVNESIRNLIMAQANAEQIQKEAVRLGMITMVEDGIQKILTGLTTIEEVLRVVKSD